ncbi:hypothetical protein [Spirosoma luteum]|uniref:hypothetical protein n=1 Tax=Spirosoma luteum TaxID=431553 RepID=UPI00037B4784|nr:hypothetical protein [Spirosoma luteum]
MNSLHSTRRLALIGIIIISLAIGCFLALHLYSLASVWVKLVEQRGSIDISGQAAFKFSALFIYGIAGFDFLRQKLNLREL